MSISCTDFLYNFSNRNKGNALFLILIAVALFAAVSYAVTQSGRGSGSIEREQAQIAAAKIIQYGSSLQQAMSRIEIVTGYKPWQVYVLCGTTRTPYDLTFCPSPGAWSSCAEADCHLFEGGPGWATPIVPGPDGFVPDADVTPAYARRLILRWIQIQGLGTSSPEIVLTFYGLTDETCREVNDRAGLGRVILVDAYTYEAFGDSPSGPPTATTNVVGDDEPLLVGQPFFCVFGHQSLNNFHYAIAEL